MKNWKKLLMLPLALGALMSCGSKTEESKGDEKITLTFATWEDNGKDFYIDKENIKEAYHKVNPNVDIEMEILPNTQYPETMQIRNTGKQLPDVFATALRFLNDYKDAYEPINDLQATKDNLYANEFAIDGNVYALPSYGFNEFVYYRKSAFEKLGLQVPTTWEEFLNVTKKLKEGGYIAVSLGLKDSWTDYPFNEFMPFYEKGGDNLWTNMGKDDEPFSPGKPFYEAYKKINDFYSLKVFGDDPLGTSWDQEQANFVSGKAAMLAAGGWYYGSFLAAADDASKNDIGVFILPTRNTDQEPFRYMVAADVFVGVNKDGKHVEAAKEFLNWYFTSEYYSKFVNWKKTEPTMKGVEVDNAMFSEAIKAIPNPQPVLQKPGDATYDNIAKQINFDVKAMGQEMMKGVNFEEFMQKYNKEWKEAKDSL